MILGRRRAEQEEKIELKMTSMVDVVFLLLIFFIVTLSIPREEAMIETNLPKARGTGEAVAEDETKVEFEDVLLTLRKSNGLVELYVNDQPIPGTYMLIAKLKTFSELYPEGRVIIDCDDKVPYRSLIEAISAAQIAELDISFANLR